MCVLYVYRKNEDRHHVRVSQTFSKVQRDITFSFTSYKSVSLQQRKKEEKRGKCKTVSNIYTERWTFEGPHTNSSESINVTLTPNQLCFGCLICIKPKNNVTGGGWVGG